MKNQTTSNYARVLYDLAVGDDVVTEADRIFAETPELLRALTSPLVSRQAKYAVIDRVFQEPMTRFLKVVVLHQHLDEIRGIFEAYQEYCENRKGIVRALLEYVEEPSEKQAEQMKEFIRRKYQGSETRLTMVKKEDLIGGFILKVGDDEYDWSIKGRIDRLQQKITWR